MHREGDRRRHIELSDLAPHITGDKLDGGSHFGHDTLGFLDTRHTALAQSFVLGNRAHLLDVRLDSRGDELAIAAHPALKIDQVVVVTNASKARLDLFTLGCEPMVLTTGRVERLLGLLQARGVLWGTAWTALFGLVPRTGWSTLQPVKLLLGFGNGLLGRPLFGRHGPRDGFDQLVLPMAEVR